MKPVRISILLRLTLWNASMLALVLTVFVVGGWFTLTRVVQERAISAVSESAQVVAGAVRAERRAISARGEVEEERGATEQAVLRELRVGNLDIFITDEEAQLMAVRQPRLPSDVGTEEEDEHRVTLPQPVLELLEAMRAGRDDDMANTLGTESGVAVRQVLLADGPARVAMMRVVPEEHDSPEEPTLLVTALMSEAGDRLLLRQVRNTLILAIPAALLASVLAGFAIARRSLSPLEAINVRTASITAANLDDRLPVVNPHDELGRLAQIINGLLSRVDLAFRTQRQFVADASHELRTPIAIIRGEAEVTLRRTARTEAEYREALAVIQGESIRLTRIVEDLFLLARVDAGGPIATRDTVELPELAVDAVRSVRSLALSQEVTVTCEIEHSAGSAITYGDASLLRRLLINLLDNAIKHTPRGSTVRVVVDRDGGDLLLRVSDEGPGVPDAIRPHVFERFVHGPKVTESAASTGAGLGLAIAQAIAHVHGGQILLAPSVAGASFEVRLPALSPAGDVA